MSDPWRSRDFRLIWAGGLVNDTGDWLLSVALPVYVLTETGSGVVAIIGVRSDARPLTREAASETSEAPPDGIRAGIAVLRRTRPLPALFTTMGIAQIAQGMFVVLFLAFVIERLGGDGSAVGIIRGAQAVGGLLGGLLLARHAARLSPAALIGLGFGGMAAWGFTFWNLPALTTAIPAYVVLMALAGPFAVTCGVGLTTAAQRFAPPAYLGLSVGALDAAGAVGQGIGAVAAGVLLDRISLTILLNGEAGLHALAALFGFAFVRRGPAAPDAVTPRRRRSGGSLPATPGG